MRTDDWNVLVIGSAIVGALVFPLLARVAVSQPPKWSMRLWAATLAATAMGCTLVVGLAFALGRGRPTLAMAVLISVTIVPVTLGTLVGCLLATRTKAATEQVLRWATWLGSAAGIAIAAYGVVFGW